MIVATVAASITSATGMAKQALSLNDQAKILFKGGICNNNSSNRHQRKRPSIAEITTSSRSNTSYTHQRSNSGSSCSTMIAARSCKTTTVANTLRVAWHSRAVSKLQWVSTVERSVTAREAPKLIRVGALRACARQTKTSYACHTTLISTTKWIICKSHKSTTCGRPITFNSRIGARRAANWRHMALWETLGFNINNNNSCNSHIRASMARSNQVISTSILRWEKRIKFSHPIEIKSWIKERSWSSKIRVQGFSRHAKATGTHWARIDQNSIK